MFPQLAQFNDLQLAAAATDGSAVFVTAAEPR